MFGIFSPNDIYRSEYADAKQVFRGKSKVRNPNLLSYQTRSSEMNKAPNINNHLRSIDLF